MALELLTECQSFSPCFPPYFCHTFKQNVKVINSVTPGIMSDLVHRYVCYEEINAQEKTWANCLIGGLFIGSVLSRGEAEFLTTNNLEHDDVIHMQNSSSQIGHYKATAIKKKCVQNMVLFAF